MWYLATALVSSPLGAELDESSTARVPPAARDRLEEPLGARIAAEQEDGLDAVGRADQAVRVVEVAGHALDALGPGPLAAAHGAHRVALGDERLERRAADVRRSLR